MNQYHEFFGVAAFLISMSGSAIYIASIFRGETKPHVYTHLVWGIITAIAFFAQLHDHAGPGSWATGITALACLTQAALALKYGEKNITLSDKISLLTSLSAIISWVITKDPLMSVTLSSIIGAVAFYPTIRKSWQKPWEENLTAYNIGNIKLALSLTALSNFTLTTTLYPFTSMALNAAFVLVCLYRRKSLTQAEGIAVAA